MLQATHYHEQRTYINELARTYFFDVTSHRLRTCILAHQSMLLRTSSTQGSTSKMMSPLHKVASKMRANTAKPHSKTMPMPHLIFSTPKNTSACLAHSQRACHAEKRCKNRREHVRFSSKVFCIFRAEGNARSKS